MASRKKNFAISFRVDDDIKDAIEKAAADDSRTVTSYAEKVLRDDLRKKGYLQPPGEARPVKAKRKGQ
jgi:hypothetical protein